jgi:uncharacterized protein YdhG (YjbR/CyaY superfamily)
MPAMKSAPAKSVNAYLNIAPEDVRIALERLRKIIKAAAPGSTEAVSYRIPIFKYQGHPFVGLSVARNRCSFYVMSSSMIPKLGTSARRRAQGLRC